MIIDCHGHYTTEPSQLTDYRKSQLDALDADPSFIPTPADLKISDDEILNKKIEFIKDKIKEIDNTIIF